jgi:serine/threonine protein kinase
VFEHTHRSMGAAAEVHNGICSWALGTLIYEMMVGYAPFEGDDQMTTFRNIVSGRLEFPDFIDDMYARDIVRNLLARDVVDRLGCRKDGAQEIFEHPWFRDMDFVELVEKRSEAPWLPELEAEDDCRYFESYEDSEGEAEVDGQGDPLAEGEERGGAAEDSGDDDEQEDGEEEDRFSFVDAIPERLVVHAEHVPSLGMSSISETTELPWFEGV